MSRRIIPDHNTGVMLRLDEAAGGNPVDVGPNSLTSVNHGTYAVTGITGFPFTVARRFASASSHYIDIPDHAGLRPATILISAWVRFVSFPGSTQVFISRYESSFLGGYMVYYDYPTGQVRFAVKAVDASYRYAGFAVSDTNRHSLCAMYDGLTVKLLWDGAEVASTTYGSVSNINYSGTSYPLRLGANTLATPPVANFFNGELADVEVYGKPNLWRGRNVYKALTDPAAGLGVEP